MSRVNKETVNQLLQEENFSELLELFDAAPRSVRKYITMASFSRDKRISEGAVKCFGYLAQKRGASQPEFFKETIRRHIWAMNDESGNMDWLAPEIIARMVVAQPELFSQYASIMIEAALKEPVFYPGLKRAVKLLAATDERLVSYRRSRLEQLGLITKE